MVNNCRISMNVGQMKKRWFLVKKSNFDYFIWASSLAIPKVLSKQLYALFCTYICASRFYRNNDCQSSFIIEKSATIFIEKLKMGLKGPKWVQKDPKRELSLRGGGHPEIFLGPIFAFFGISKNCMKKEKFWCRLEQNRVTGGRTARVFAKTPKMDPKLKKCHFWRFFENSKNMRFLP